jgi:16S rRNA (guanine527-N7)-methyltransferase
VGTPTLLATGTERLGWTLSAAQLGLLERWLDAVLDENRRLNLTAVRSREEGILRHLVDSLAFGLHLAAEPSPPAPVWVDLGSGGGFPGVPAAIAAPAATVHVVDSRAKKVAAVARLAAGLGIPNVLPHAGRLEDLARKGGELHARADLVFARGVGTLAACAGWARDALAGSGVLLCWKSDPVAEDERAEGLAAARRLGLAPLPDLPYVSFKPCVLVRYRRS